MYIVIHRQPEIIFTFHIALGDSSSRQSSACNTPTGIFRRLKGCVPPQIKIQLCQKARFGACLHAGFF